MESPRKGLVMRGFRVFCVWGYAVEQTINVMVIYDGVTIMRRYSYVTMYATHAVLIWLKLCKVQLGTGS